MGIYIKGMDMPKTCEECRLESFCNLWVEAIKMSGVELKVGAKAAIRHPDCPLVSIPEQGKWVNYGDEYRPDIRCCVCGQRKPILLGNFNFNYCPNCGVKMDLEE